MLLRTARSLQRQKTGLGSDRRRSSAGCSSAGDADTNKWPDELLGADAEGQAAAGSDVVDLPPPSDNPVAKMMFERYDADHSGYIDRAELQAVCAQLGSNLAGGSCV